MKKEYLGCKKIILLNPIKSQQRTAVLQKLGFSAFKKDLCYICGSGISRK